MTQKAAVPLIAKLQKAPDAAWGPLLAELDDAKQRYDPELQTSHDALRDGKPSTYRTSSSGGAIPLSAEDEGKVTTRDHSENSSSYRTLASGGSVRFEDDGGKDTLPDRAGHSGSYRVLSSGGAILFTDDGSGGKDTPTGS